VFEQVGPAGLLAVLLRSLGASPFQIGVLVSLLPIGMAVQALSVPLLERIRSRRRSLAVVSAASAAPYLLMAAGLWLIADAVRAGGATWGVRIITLCFAFVALICGVREIGYFELAGATVEESRRGRFFGLRDAVTAVAGVLGGLAVAVILSRYEASFPVGYVIILTAGSAAVLLGSGLLLLSSDRNRKPQKGRPDPFDLLKRMPGMLAADRQLTLHVVWRSLLQASRSAHAFLIVFTLARFSLGDQASGLFLLTIAASRFAAGFPCGWITDRLGEKRGIVLVAGISLVLKLVAIAVVRIDVGTGFAYLMFGILGIFKAMWFSADSAMVLKMTKPDLHLRYVSLARLAPLPVTLLVRILTGFIAGRWGYGWAFSLSAFFAVAALGVAFVIHKSGSTGRNMC
jgi:MFS family permease